MNRSRCIAAVWMGVLLSGLPLVGQEATSPPESLEHPAAQRRLDIHADLPADANLEDLLHVRTSPQIDPEKESLDASCPCRGAFVDEGSSERPRSDRPSRPVLIFGSVVLVCAAMVAGWQIYHGHR